MSAIPSNVTIRWLFPFLYFLSCLFFHPIHPHTRAFLRSVSTPLHQCCFPLSPYIYVASTFKFFRYRQVPTAVLTPAPVHILQPLLTPIPFSAIGSSHFSSLIQLSLYVYLLSYSQRSLSRWAFSCARLLTSLSKYLPAVFCFKLPGRPSTLRRWGSSFLLQPLLPTSSSSLVSTAATRLLYPATILFSDSLLH